MRIADNTNESLPIIASLIETENGAGGLPSRLLLYLLYLVLCRLQELIMNRTMNIMNITGLNNRMLISRE